MAKSAAQQRWVNSKLQSAISSRHIFFAAGRPSTAILHLHGFLPGPGAFWKGVFPSDAWDFTATVPEYGLVLLYLQPAVEFNSKNNPTYPAKRSLLALYKASMTTSEIKLVCCSEWFVC